MDLNFEIKIIQHFENKGEFTLDSLIYFIKKEFPEITDETVKKYIDYLIAQNVIKNKKQSLFIFTLNERKEFNFSKGMKRFNILFSLIIFPIFTISYYVLFRNNATQELHLSNGDILKVKPFITNGAEILNPGVFNENNCTQIPLGYSFNNETSKKWNSFVDFLILKKFTFRRLSFQDTFQRYRFLLQFEDNTKRTFEVNEKDSDWQFNSNTGILKTNEGSFNLNFETFVRDYIERQDLNSEDNRWPNQIVFSDTNDINYLINPLLFMDYDDLNTKRFKFLTKESAYNATQKGIYADQLPFFYNHQLPLNHYNFFGNDNGLLYHFDWIIWQFQLSKKVYFIEPPLIKTIQSIFSSRKKYLTTTSYFTFSLILLLFYWLVVSLIRYIINGFFQS